MIPANFLGFAGGPVLASALTGSVKGVDNVGNYLFPTGFPSYNEIMASRRKGFMTEKVARHILRMNNVDMPPDNPQSIESFRHWAWHAHREASWTWPDETIYWRAWRAGRIDDVGMHEGWALNNKRWENWSGVMDLVLEWPTLAEWDDAYQRGFIPQDVWNQVRVSYFCNTDLFNRTLEAKRLQPGVFDLQEMYNRKLITDDEFKRGIQRLNLNPNEWNDRFRQLADKIPGVSDLVRFQVREAFDPELARQLGLYKERPREIEEYFAMQGLGGGPGFVIGENEERRLAKWSDIYWAAHWQPLSPQQNYEFYHRFRPDRIDRYQRQGFHVLPWTLEQVNLHLRVADYPPGVRDYLAAAAYRPMRLVDIKNRLKFQPGPETDQWALDQLLDRGYHPDDAVVARDLFKRQASNAGQAGVDGIANSAPKRLWKVVEKAYKTGSLSAQSALVFAQQINLPQAAAASILNTLDLEWHADQMKTALTVVRSDYLSGLTSDDEMVARLNALDLQPRPRDNYIAVWRMQRGSRRKILSAKDALESYKMGLIGEFDLRTRLHNLGFDMADSNIMVARAQVEIGQEQAKALKTAERESEANAKKMESQVRRGQTMVRQHQADLARMTPVAKLIKWAKEGHIDKDTFYSRMDAMGYERGAIDLYWADVLADGTNGHAPLQNGQNHN